MRRCGLRAGPLCPSLSPVDSSDCIPHQAASIRRHIAHYFPFRFASGRRPGQMGNRDIIRIVVVLAARRDISYPDRQTVSPTPIRIVPHISFQVRVPHPAAAPRRRSPRGRGRALPLSSVAPSLRPLPRPRIRLSIYCNTYNILGFSAIGHSALRFYIEYTLFRHPSRIRARLFRTR